MSDVRTIRLDDGAQTALEMFGNEGPLMLAVHGMTSSRKAWQRLAQAYGDRFRVAAYDQRGHGESASVEGPMSLHRALLDLYNVLEAVDESVDVLIGHSWGGAVAILGGRRFDVRRVAAIDPMVRQNPREWYDEVIAETRGYSKLQPAERERKLREDYADWDPDDLSGKVHALQTMTHRPIERLRDENPPETWDLRPDMEDYPKPLFLALADPEESIVAREDVKELREHVGPNVVLRIFEGEGHNLHRTDFDWFSRELDAFLDRTKE